MVLCHMDYLPPFLVQGTHRLKTAEIAGAAADYGSLLEALRDGRVDADRVSGREHMNDVLPGILSASDP